MHVTGSSRYRLPTLKRRALTMAGESPAERWFGPGAWSGMLQTSPVSRAVRYEVLTRDRAFQLCGAIRDDTVLEVDHIMPRSTGGANDMDNLHELCRPCNQGKSNLDATDFT